MAKVSLGFNDKDLDVLDKKAKVSEETRYGFCMRVVKAALYDADEKIAVPPKSGKVKKVGRTVYLDNFVLKEAQFRAKQRGMSTGAYVSALVQASVTRTTVFRHHELEAVIEANRQLAAVGRNLNQVARHLNDRFTETDRLKLELIEQLKLEIDAQRVAIYSLVKASRRSWGADDE